LTDAIPLSDPSLILPDAPPPSLPSMLGTEPARSWCYFYEKAELARQRGDWAEVAQLGGQAFKQGLAPEEAYEWLPFIEADARTGSLEQAEKLSLKVAKENPVLVAGLCELWSRVRADGIGTTEELLSQLKCQP
jgi:hypothetical protein